MMKGYRVYFNDGNQKLYQAFDLGHLVDYLRKWTACSYHPYVFDDIYKIERVEDEDTDTQDSEQLDRFYSRFYSGLYLDSYDQKTPLKGLCHCVGYPIRDEEGYEWRSFSDGSWEKVKDLTNEEIYAKYPPAPSIEGGQGMKGRWIQYDADF